MKEGEKGQKAIEDEYSLKPVPLEYRKPWTYHAAAWAGVVFVLAALMGGATPLAFLPANLSIITIILGNLILFTIFTLTSYMGAKTGLTTYLIAQSAFGKFGSRILINLVISGIPAFAWYGVETWLAAAAIGVIAGWDIGGPGRLMDLPSAIFTLLAGILMAIPPVLGITSIAIIDYISIPIMVVLVAYGLYLGFSIGASGALLSYTPSSFTPETMFSNFMITLNVVIGLIIVGATIGSDTARWIRPEKKSVFTACFLGFFLTAVFMEIIGLFYGIAAIKAGLDPSLAWNIILVLKQLGVTTGPLWPLLLLAFLLQFTTNMLNAYGGGLALTATVGKSSWRSYFTIGGAIVGSIIAVLGIVWYWIPYLTALANWVAPAAGILLAEFYLIKKGSISLETITSIRVEALLGWFVGGLASYYLTLYMPFFVPSLVGMIIAIIIHLIGFKFHKI